MRPAQTSASATVLQFAQADAVPARPRMTAATAGEADSREALARLEAAVAELKAMRVQPLLENAVAALRESDFKGGGDWALKALEQDERSGFAWYLLAIAREKMGDFASAIRCYESALGLIPEHGAIANDLGRLAYRLGMKETAEKLFRHFLAYQPGHHEGANNLACALRDQGRCDEAIDLLRPVLMENPGQMMLWNTLGSVVFDQGDPATAITFFDEAIRLNPDFAKARYNRGNARVPLGELDQSLADCEAALTFKLADDERPMMELSRATTLLALGRAGEGWDAYEARLNPRFTDVTNFAVERPRWQPDSDLDGKTLLVIGEQGLGDEVLFANVLPDVIEALGPNGKLMVAVEPRLVPLFQRSYPTAEVGAHATYTIDGHCVRAVHFLQDETPVDLWTPMASLLRRWRREVDAFPDRPSFLAPDPARIAHWRAELAKLPAGRKIGVLWKSLKLDGHRSHQFTPFQQWAPVLAAPGAVFVNLQYGDCADELARAEAEMGVEIWNPPGIDLKQDLDDVAALCCALDLVIGPPNATTNIAAACGAPTWLISNLGAWPRLGTERYPWYPQARVFVPTAFGRWDDVMDAVAKALV